MVNNKDVSSKMTTFEQIETCLYCSQCKRIPALSTEWAQEHFSREWTKTASGVSFLLGKDGSGEEKIVVFATNTNIKMLCETDTIFTDRTSRHAKSSFIKSFPYMYLKVSKTH